NMTSHVCVLLLLLSSLVALFFFTSTPPTHLYTLSLHDALPISEHVGWRLFSRGQAVERHPSVRGNRDPAARLGGRRAGALNDRFGGAHGARERSRAPSCWAPRLLARRGRRAEGLHHLRVEGLLDALARVGVVGLRVRVELVGGDERPTQGPAQARERGPRYRARVFRHAGLRSE